MLTKQKTLTRNGATLFPRKGSMVDYSLYKFTDIHPTAILQQGHLHYRYGQIKFLKLSQTAIFYVVLARIPLDANKTIIGLYLYRNIKQRPANFFQLNEYDEIGDRTSKPFWPEPVRSYFELRSKQTNDVEIFGAIDDNERKVWVGKLKEALIWTQEHPIDAPSLPGIPRARSSRREEPGVNREPDEVNIQLIYPDFQDVQPKENTSSRFSSPDPIMNNNDDAPSIIRFHFPPPPPRPPPLGKPYSYIVPNGTESGRRHSTPVEQHVENAYLSAIRLPPIHDAENGNNAPQFSPSQIFNVKLRPTTNSIPQQNTIPHETTPTLQNNVQPTEQQTFTWDQIFCKANGERILKQIGQLGVFLVRNQSKKTDRHESGYVLSIYAFDAIRKYRIFLSSNGECTLLPGRSNTCFADIPQLCQYYTSHTLPHSLKNEHDNSTESADSVNDLRLAAPYSFYADQFYYLDL